MDKRRSTTGGGHAPRLKPAKPYPGFPLFPHATGRWAKKIRGRFAFFGPWEDWRGALERYLDTRDELYAGRPVAAGMVGLEPREPELVRGMVLRVLRRWKRRDARAGITPRASTSIPEPIDFDGPASMPPAKLACDLRPCRLRLPIGQPAPHASNTSHTGRVQARACIDDWGRRPLHFPTVFIEVARLQCQPPAVGCMGWAVDTTRLNLVSEGTPTSYQTHGSTPLTCHSIEQRASSNLSE